MADLVRSAKSGSRWGTNKLIAFNIELIDKNTQPFFDTHLASAHEPAGSLHKADMDFFAYMEDAMAIPPGEESFVGDFAAFVLRMMRYDEGRRVVHLRREMGFEMCGQRVDAKADVYVMERSGTGAKYLLLVQEDKYHLSKDDPEPQLIAGAIAAFYEINRALKAAGLPKLQSKTFAGITMVGTTPTFYKIPVTNEILISLATSQYPSQVTTVERLVPPVPFPERLVSDGMKTLSNRRIILQCFEAFRQFVNVARIETKTLEGYNPLRYHRLPHGRTCLR
ncbi:hypothetical protein EDB92DRAFT_1933054 [Lactarius akahatsu]|uniref:Uncharacterized protein n=1 Tax=Lactarius akahatsu TaxID=416441 RepID=A0AAD4QGZ5_9AGAM|nr:hypothetical protein EDB92DRAFT_1933054 [Lactarius akahatsu]